MGCCNGKHTNDDHVVSILEIRDTIAQTDGKVQENYIREFMNIIPVTTNINLEFKDGWHADRSKSQKKPKESNNIRTYVFYMGLQNKDAVQLTEKQVQLYNDIKLMSNGYYPISPVRRKSFRASQIVPLSD